MGVSLCVLGLRLAAESVKNLSIFGAKEVARDASRLAIVFVFVPIKAFQVIGSSLANISGDELKKQGVAFGGVPCGDFFFAPCAKVFYPIAEGFKSFIGGE